MNLIKLDCLTGWMMGKGESRKFQIIRATSYDQLKRSWRVRFLVLNFFYLMMVGALGVLVIQSPKANDPFILEKDLFEEYKTKETIYSILRKRNHLKSRFGYR